MNYPYYIGTNFKPIVEMDLVGKVGTDEVIIFEFMKLFARNGNCDKIEENGELYYKFTHNFISKQLPILNIKSTKGIKKKIDKLTKAGLIEPNKNNQQKRASYYKFGSRYNEYKSYCKNNKMTTELGTKVPTNSEQKLPLTRNKSSDNNNNKNKINNNNDHFVKFWDKYPKKVAKKTAKSIFNKLKESEQLEAIKGIYKVKQKDKKYIPHPTTYLNQARWEDETEIEENEIKDYYKGVNITW
ncbi:MAG: hypothetical protein ACE364_00525 [Chlorobiota bacterium]